MWENTESGGEGGRKNRQSVASVRDAEFWSYNIIPACRGFANNEDEEGGKSFKIQMAKDGPIAASPLPPPLLKSSKSPTAMFSKAGGAISF